jgi:hypothetical protein
MKKEELSDEELNSIEEFAMSIAVKPFVKSIKYRFDKRGKNGIPHIHFFVTIKNEDSEFIAEFFEDEK